MGRGEGLSLPWCSDVAIGEAYLLLDMLRKKVKVKCNRQSKKKCNKKSALLCCINSGGE